MMVDQRIPYATGVADWGVGIVIEYDDDTEIVKVQDEEDRTLWRGPSDMTESLDED